MKQLDHTVFELRQLEEMDLYTEPPMYLPPGTWIGVRVVPVTLPDGPVAKYAPNNPDERAVEHCALVGCGLNDDGEWQWVHVNPSTKAHLIDFLVDDAKVDRDRWYYIAVRPIHRKKIAGGGENG